MDTKSPEFIKMENDNKAKDKTIDEYKEYNHLTDERLSKLESKAKWDLNELEENFG
jgi:hypothetical protein